MGATHIETTGPVCGSYTGRWLYSHCSRPLPRRQHPLSMFLLHTGHISSVSWRCGWRLADLEPGLHFRQSHWSSCSRQLNENKMLMEAGDIRIGTWSWGVGSSLTVVIKQLSEENVTGTCGIHPVSLPPRAREEHAAALQVSGAPCSQLWWPKVLLPLPSHPRETQFPRGNALLLCEGRRGEL